ncbi:MAG TPA: hypothetical protein VMY42_07300 [Thermoguttaceae bacterium]|nr:hypothetical protein [Thermoguttaceae bacterium]
MSTEPEKAAGHGPGPVSRRVGRTLHPFRGHGQSGETIVGHGPHVRLTGDLTARPTIASVGRERVEKRALVVPLILVSLAFALLASHACCYLPFIADDALISLRYSQRLLEGHGLTWTDGRPVEGYSNLLWVLSAAGVGRLGVDLIVGVRILGFASAGLLFGAVGCAYRATTVRRSLPLIVALLTLATASPIAIWTIGGLEAILVAALLSWAMVLCYPVFARDDAPRRYPLAASVFLGLLCITRPDGAIYTAAVVLALLPVKGIGRRTFRTALLLGLLPAAFYLGQLVFRLAYYGEWIPNTARVKLSLSWEHLSHGGEYVLRGFFAMGPVFLSAVLLGVLLLVQRRDRPARARMALLAVALVAWSVYVTAISGDTFPGWRHLVPLVALMALILAEGTRWLVQHGGVRVGTRTVVCVLAVVFGASCYLQNTDTRNRKALTERWEWDGQVVGLMLEKGFGPEQPLLAVTACGCLPYWSELPSLDMLGLNDYYLPRHKPEGFGQGQLAHELGDGQYVLDCRPDLIIFTGPHGREKAHFLSGRQMQQQPEFYRRYTLATFEGREPYPVRSLIWLRRESEKIGIRRSDDRIVVPGYLLNAHPATVAYLDASGEFVVSVTPDTPAGIANLSLPPGRWKIDADATAEVRVVVRPAGEDVVLQAGPTGISFCPSAEDDRSVDVTLEAASQQPVEVRRLVLERL